MLYIDHKSKNMLNLNATEKYIYKCLKKNTIFFIPFNLSLFSLANLSNRKTKDEEV